MSIADRIAEETVAAFRERPEWSEDGLVNMHEVADMLEETLISVTRVMAGFPDGWNPGARVAFGHALIDVISRLMMEVP
jgi:hypothetical protein